MSLSDLDELTLKCRENEGREYVREAVACYKSGAFRACIVATWIAVVYDILSKLKELALAGSADARQLSEELTRLHPLAAGGDMAAIRRMLEIERTVIDVANEKFGFFDGQQMLDLRRLHDDRNRCAHPTYQGLDQIYIPSPELVRTHLVHAVNHVLSVPPVQGKAAAAQIVRLVESKYFPTEVDDAKIQLRSAGLDRPKDSLVRAVVDELVHGLFDGNAALKAQKKTLVAIRAVVELFPGICEPRLRKAINSLGRKLPDEALIIVFGLLKHVQQAWGFLEADNISRLSEVLRQSSDDTAALIIPICIDIPDLRPICIAKLNSFEGRELGLALQKSQHPLIIATAVDLFCRSGSWAQANSTYDHAIQPIIDQLGKDQIHRIVSSANEEGVDLRSARGFVRFLENVYDRNTVDRAELEAFLIENGLEGQVKRLRLRAEGPPAF